jgi:hypothetical protein
VGIAVLICMPVFFLVWAYVLVSSSLYRKQKAVYLLSRGSARSDGRATNAWDLRVVAGWMGMSLKRGKWRPMDPSKCNTFVFRWGPVFEDCRGELFSFRCGAADS